MKTIAFVSLLLFALLFLLSYLPAISDSGYGNRMNFAGQAGMSISILIFFIIHRRKKPSAGREEGTN